jgi:hypothetical protein
MLKRRTRKVDICGRYYIYRMEVRLEGCQFKNYLLRGQVECPQKVYISAERIHVTCKW